MIKNKGIIFLNGGGDAKDSLELDKIFVSHLENNAKILYIPHANQDQYPNFTSSLDWINETLNNIDKNKKLEITIPKSYEEFKTITLDKYNAIYIGGGNTYFLLNLLIKYNFTEKLINYYNNGGLIYGGSAGAIILGKSIETVIDEKNNPKESSQGLNLINNYSIVCHTTTKIIKSLTNNENLKPILALYENSGIILKNNILHSVEKKYEQLN